MRSEIRACGTPNSLAERACVSLFARRKVISSRIIADRMRRFSTSAGVKPRSEKTSVLRLRGRRCVISRDPPFEVLPDTSPAQSDGGPGRFSGFLAESVQHVNGALEF